MHDRIGLADGFVTPYFRIVLHDLWRKHKDVLVHERDAEIGGVDCSASGVELRHPADARAIPRGGRRKSVNEAG